MTKLWSLHRFRASWGHQGLTVSGYRLPATLARNPRQIGFQVAPGQTLFVTGASGSGKTTLPGAITTALLPAPGVVTAVLADDYLLTDEPVTGLDTATATQVLAAIRRRLPHAILILAIHQLPARPDILGRGWTTVPLD
jgi:ABC-type glutathione transport system ATPase component